jgi:hypothetical protein
MQQSNPWYAKMNPPAETEQILQDLVSLFKGKKELMWHFPLKLTRLGVII